MPKTRQSAALRNLSHSANDLFWFILPLVLPLLLIRYNLSYARAGSILTVYLAVTAISSYVMGKVSDGIPRRFIMGFGFYLAAAGLIAAGFAESFTFFLFFLVITAVGVSTFHPVMYANIDETFGNDKAKALGAYEASGTAAILIMFLVNGALLGTIGTRGVMITTALPALVMGTLLLKTRMMDAAPAIAESPGQDKLKADEPNNHASVVLFGLFLFTIILRFASVMAILNFLPTIFTGHFGLQANRAAWATGLFFVGGIFGSFAASRFSRPDRSYRILVLGSFIIAPLIALLALDVPLPFHFAATLLFGSFASGLIVNQNLILTTLGSRFGRGEAFGIMMAVVTLSQSISPALFGLSVDKWGFSPALLIFSIPVILSAILLMTLSRRILKITDPG
jgi:MFS family permease